MNTFICIKQHKKREKRTTKNSSIQPSLHIHQTSGTPWHDPISLYFSRHSCIRSTFLLIRMRIITCFNKTVMGFFSYCVIVWPVRGTVRMFHVALQWKSWPISAFRFFMHWFVFFFLNWRLGHTCVIALGKVGHGLFGAEAKFLKDDDLYAN